MTKHVGLVACSKSKRGEDEPETTYRAEDFYDSWLFDGRVRAVKAHCDEWGIFSAKHGYLEPDDDISWYDQKITELDTTKRFRLAAQVVADLPETDRLLILMGRDYADPLLAMLPKEIEVWDPLEGVHLFDQRNELRRLAERGEVAMSDGGMSSDVESFYQEREEQYRRLNIREHVDGERYIVDCPGCGEPMILGHGWMGCSIPECPDCETVDSWTEDPRITEARAERVADGAPDVTELVRS